MASDLKCLIIQRQADVGKRPEALYFSGMISLCQFRLKSYSLIFHGEVLSGVPPTFGVAIVMGGVGEIFAGPLAARASFSPVSRTGLVTSSGTLNVLRQES